MDVVLKPERTIKCRACGHEAKGASGYVWHYCAAFYERELEACKAVFGELFRELDQKAARAGINYKSCHEIEWLPCSCDCETEADCNFGDCDHHEDHACPCEETK